MYYVLLFSNSCWWPIIIKFFCRKRNDRHIDILTQTIVEIVLWRGGGFFIRKIQLWERAKKLLLHRTSEPRCKIFVVQNISRLVLKTRRCVIKGLCFVSIVVVMLENCEEEKSAHRILPIGSKKKELQIVLLGLIMDLSTIQKPFGLRA